VAVIGGGIVGLAIARELAERGGSVVVFERHAALGTEQSTHNSQVIHSGLFAPPGTLRARLNVEGAKLLYERASEWKVPVDRSGTLVIAGDPADLPRLDRYASWGRSNGVEGVRRCTPKEAHAIEPGLGPVLAAVHSPNGGRIDAVALLRALERESQYLGVEVRLGAGVDAAQWTGDRWRLTDATGAACDVAWVVNAAGVGAARVAAILGAPDLSVFPCLGEYAWIRGARRETIRSMVYGFPPPGFPGIGVHLTRLLSGELLLGPTATYLDAPILPPRPLTSLADFCREAAPYLPGLTVEELAPAPAGIRAKSVPPGSGEAFGDFLIEARPVGRHAVQLVGIESPGLSSCLAIARYVAERVAPS
jgi:L-2-hydroxyglutarate oxidase LhgO